MFEDFDWPGIFFGQKIFISISIILHVYMKQKHDDVSIINKYLFTKRGRYRAHPRLPEQHELNIFRDLFG